jgi:hypothetical protein
VFNFYNYALSNVQLSGPTNFAPSLRQILQGLPQNPERTNSYEIALILTDGLITDMWDTIDVIVQMSDKPVSIIIVGVGNQNFSKMDELDADDAPLVSNGQFAKRDIVQFVEFNKFKNNPRMLAEEVLREVPGQVTSYYASKGVNPTEANRLSDSQLNTAFEQGMTRQGQVMDQQFYQQHPQGAGIGLLGALGLNPAIGGRQAQAQPGPETMVGPGGSNMNYPEPPK